MIRAALRGFASSWADLLPLRILSKIGGGGGMGSQCERAVSLDSGFALEPGPAYPACVPLSAIVHHRIKNNFLMEGVTKWKDANF